jgi:hypothetical protein
MLRHRLSAALALAAILLVGRGAVALAFANAYWAPAFNDPGRVDISDLSNLVAKTVSYRDPMDDARRALVPVVQTSGRVPLPSTPTIENVCPRAHRPRAPPAA